MIYISTGGNEPYGCDGCHLKRFTDPVTILPTSTYHQQTIMEDRTLAFGQDVYRHKLAAQALVYAFLYKELSIANFDLTGRCGELTKNLRDAWRDGEGDLGRIKEEVTKHFENRNVASHYSIFTPEALIAMRTYILLSTIEAARLVYEALWKEFGEETPKSEIFKSWLDALEKSRKVFSHDYWGDAWYKAPDQNGYELLTWRRDALDLVKELENGVSKLLLEYPNHSTEAETTVKRQVVHIVERMSKMKGSWDRFKFVWRCWQYCDGEAPSTTDETQTRLELESLQSDRSNPSLSALAGEALFFISSSAEYGSSQTRTSVVGTSEIHG
jgi:hypothetical protein